MKRLPHVRTWLESWLLWTWKAASNVVSPRVETSNATLVPRKRSFQGWRTEGVTLERDGVALPAAELHVIPDGKSEVRQAGPTWRRWTIAALLVGLPIAVYWPTIFYHYGFRDDYSMLREAHEEPGKILRVCAMQARPVFGFFLEHAFQRTQAIGDLWRLRFVGALLIGATAAALFMVLRGMKWDRWTAAGVAALLTVIPSAQITAAWAVGWPLPIALLLALGGFSCAERSFVMAAGFDARGRRSVAWRRGLWWGIGAASVAIAALIYQPNSLFYFVPVTSALWAHRRWSLRHKTEWLVRHFATAGLGLTIAFTITLVSFARGWVPASGRIALEHDWVGKIEWFVRQPLQNALALIALNDDAGSRVVHRLAALMVIVLIGAVARTAATRGWRHGVWLLGAIGSLGVASFIVNLIVDDRWTVYRVLLPLTGTIAAALAMALLTLGGRGLARTALAGLVGAGAWLARTQTYDLIAVPQGIELNAITAGAARIVPELHPRVYVLTPVPQDHIAPRIFSDEFGSLSTDSDWVPKEMLEHVMHERYPQMPNVNAQYTVACGRILPPGQTFDVVIDLRRMR
jgi:hypothetical protein